ncbi:MAG: uroporphyrinogen decarboxylase [Azospirillaceae bacterium]
MDIPVGNRPLLDQLTGRPVSRRPIWLMRQAGRYLPEYRDLRARAGGFLDLCYTPEQAVEVTLQPLRRFDLDAAILFSDILVVPHGLGRDLRFEAGEGPRLEPIVPGDLPALDLAGMTARLAPVYEAVAGIRARLPAGITFVGFAGSPWTVACYMVEGRGSKDFAAARTMAQADSESFAHLVAILVEATVEHLSAQIEAGVDCVQLFDSWAGVLSPDQVRRWVIAPNAAIVRALRQRHPGVPVIGFPRMDGASLLAYAEEVPVSALGLDTAVDPQWAAAQLSGTLALQGNLDPTALIAGGPALDQAVDTILAAMAGRRHVMNLGHGIAQTTPVEHVERLIARVRHHDRGDGAGRDATTR